MKIIQLVFLAFTAILVFSYCSATKKTSTKMVPATLTYEANVQQLVTANCSPCHIPASGGKKLALDSYNAVSKNIDDIIRRIELNPSDRDFMPFKHEKLSDSTINVFKQWKLDGMLAK